MKVQAIRTEVQRLIRQSPFRPFVISLDNGDRVTIEHLENIAFEPDNGENKGSEDFYVLTPRLRVYSTFEAVNSVSLLDEGQMD
jgi:hypothetical protein